MATISTSGISPGQIIRSEHLLRVINALNGVTPIDIIITGSLSVSGSTSLSGSTYLRGLPNTSRANVITYDPTTGQLSYLNSASLGVTMSVSQPGGLNTQIQYNSGSVLAGNSSFIFNYTLQSLQQGNNVSASSTFAHAQGNQTTASGQYSHAEGATTQAKGLGSHAEGINNIASGSYSHAEGSGNIAEGLVSHAEGSSTIARGDNSHTEGRNTLTIGSFSHAEGTLTTASGDFSHTEGIGTVALGEGSHAEGLYTVALGNYQHVQGRYNISSSDTSAFIIGNGVTGSSRSNLVFASGSTFQITGSLLITGSQVTNGYSNVGTSMVVGSTTQGQIDGNSVLLLYRGQSNTSFVLGNPGLGQTNNINLNNTYGSIITSSGSLQLTTPTGSLTLNGSGSITINDILVLTPRSTTPGTPTNGMVIISGSGVDQHIYCYLNSTWKQLD
jgi:hypothetical protein